MDTVVFVVLIVLLILETILSAIWNKAYFKRGIVIFSKTASDPTTMAQIKSASTFQLHFDDAFRGQRMLFRDLEPGVVAFRERILEFRIMAFHYTPIMHGIASVDSATGRPVVKGMLNWTALAFVALFIWVSIEVADTGWISILFPVFIAALVLLIYWIQYRRYKKILEFASK